MNASLMSSEWVWNSIQWEWWVILQLIAAVLGIGGNLLVIILLFQRRKNSRSTDLLVGALATADFFTSIFMIPLPSSAHVPSTKLGQMYCKCVYTSVFMWVSVDASILTLTCIPVERYIAVVHPFLAKEFISRQKTLAAIFLTWLISVMINSFVVIFSKVNPYSNNCIVVYSSKRIQLTIGVVLFIFQFLIPTFVTLTLHLLTARALHQQSQLYLGADKRLDRSNPAVRHLIAKRRVLEMLFLVVLIYIVCWGPSQVAYLAFNLGLIPFSYLYSPLNRAFTLLAFCNSCANPIIYTVRYPEFRKAIKDLFTRSKGSAGPLFDDKARVSKSQGPSI